MKKKIIIILVGIFYCLLLAVCFYSCNKKEPECEPCDCEEIACGTELDESESFYYYSGGKLFLTQRRDMILILFTKGADVEQLQAIINSNESLQPTRIYLGEEGSSRFAYLESINGEPIPLAVICEYFKVKPEVVSVEYLYQYEIWLQGLRDMFTVLLKETTTYAQLQNLAKQNHCIIGEENRFVKNQFRLYVCKSSKLNALQAANLFYETGLFEYTQPIFTILNFFN